jgi:hypothetical protein
MATLSAARGGTVRAVWRPGDPAPRRACRRLLGSRHGPALAPTQLALNSERVAHGSSRRPVPYVHIQRDACLAKYWLAPVTLARSTGFSPRELRTIASLVETNADSFMEAWHAHFG